MLLDTSLLEKAVYELTYELNNRPPWVPVALMGIADLLGAGERGGDLVAAGTAHVGRAEPLRATRARMYGRARCRFWRKSPPRPPSRSCRRARRGPPRRPAISTRPSATPGSTVDLDGSEEAWAIALRPDGRIVIGGTQADGAGASEDGFVAQLGADSGALDPSYGAGHRLVALDSPGGPTR